MIHSTTVVFDLLTLKGVKKEIVGLKKKMMYSDQFWGLTGNREMIYCC